MANIIVGVAKYMMILLIALYTYHCFAIFAYEDDNMKKRVIHNQRVLMFMIHFMAFAGMYFKTDENNEFKFVVISDTRIGSKSQQLSILNDIYEKAEKAIYTEGACFLNVLAPCPRGWGYNTEDLMEINKLAVETCYWPLYEVIDGRYVVNYKPKNKLPVSEFLKPQKRFKHMFKEGNEWMLEELQKEVDERWERLLELEKMTNPVE